MREGLYFLYAVLIVTVVVVVPTGRALWLALSTTQAVSVLSSSFAPLSAGLVAAAMWFGALIVGSTQGPALLPPLLTSVLAGSDLPRFVIFGRPIGRVFVGLSVVSAVAAGMSGSVLLSVGLSTTTQVVAFTMAGALVGSIALPLLLLGQCFPRAACVAAAGGVVTVILQSVAFPGLFSLVPWGWVSQLYPVQSAWLPLLLLLVVAAALLAAVPAVLERLRVEDLQSQSLRWETVTTLAGTLELSTASAVYRARPKQWRSLRAVRSHANIAFVFSIRDLVGASRTPARLLVGLLSIGVAAVLVFSSGAVANGTIVMGAAAGVLLFVGLGPLTDGIRHAAAVTAGRTIYGLEDRTLLAVHALMPLVLSASLTVSVVLTAGLATASPFLESSTKAFVLLLSALAMQINNALKGPLPLAMLASMPSPMGDPMPLLRLLWAVDGLVLAVLAGIVATDLPHAYLYSLTLLLVLGATTVHRWRRRALV